MTVVLDLEQRPDIDKYITEFFKNLDWLTYRQSTGGTARSYMRKEWKCNYDYVFNYSYGRKCASLEFESDSDMVSFLLTFPPERKF